MTTAEPMQQELLTVREAADLLRITDRTLHKLTSPRGPVPSVRIRRRVFYRTAAILAFIAQQEH